MLLLAATGWRCSTTAPATLMPIEISSHTWHHRQHHKGDGFRNIWGPSPDAPFLKTGGWLLGRAFQNRAHVTPPVVPVDTAALRLRPARLRLTWLGHASTYVQTAGLDVLLDPMFSERASPVAFAGPSRQTPLPLEPDELPGVDVVLISHNHYDHLDERTVRRLAERFDPLFLVPLGVAETVRQWGGRAAELDWWQYADVEGLRFHCTPARHFSGRSLLDRDETLWSGWYLESRADSDVRLFFAGDTGYASHFTEVRERLGPPEVALLPIGAYLPRWFMAPVHVDPQEAVQAFLDLEARHFIPVHWGVFDLADERLQDPPEALRRHAEALGVMDRVHILEVGGIFSPEAPPGNAPAARSR